MSQLSVGCIAHSVKMISAGNVAVLIALIVMVEAHVPLRHFEPTRMNEGNLRRVKDWVQPENVRETEVNGNN